jgi:hypothetical protein
MRRSDDTNTLLLEGLRHGNDANSLASFRLLAKRVERWRLRCDPCLCSWTRVGSSLLQPGNQAQLFLQQQKQRLLGTGKTGEKKPMRSTVFQRNTGRKLGSLTAPTNAQQKPKGPCWAKSHSFNFAQKYQVPNIETMPLAVNIAGLAAAQPVKRPLSSAALKWSLYASSVDK